jgi:hypothetical protein
MILKFSVMNVCVQKLIFFKKAKLRGPARCTRLLQAEAGVKL